jgi:hypothetical protein
VTASGAAVAIVHTDSFTVNVPPATPVTSSRTAPAKAHTEDPKDIPWRPIGALILALAAATTFLQIHRKTREI